MIRGRGNNAAPGFVDLLGSGEQHQQCAARNHRLAIVFLPRKHEEGWNRTGLPSLSPCHCDVPVWDRPPGRLPGVVPVALALPFTIQSQLLTGLVPPCAYLLDLSHRLPLEEVHCVGFS